VPNCRAAYGIISTRVGDNPAYKPWKPRVWTISTNAVLMFG